MKTHEQLKAESLAIITTRGHIHEGELLELLFPPPAFPGAQSGEAALNAWRDARHAWTTNAYGGDGIEYRDSYASDASRATIDLTKEGRINEHNNGYASYTFTPRT
jgi:hypothetical protein